MGPLSRYLGPWVAEPQLWQDPVPAVDHELVGDADVAALKTTILASGLSVSQLVSHRVGGRGELPRHRQAGRGERRPDPPRAAARLGGQRAGRARRGAARPSKRIQQDFNGAQSGGKKVSLADLIVLGGCAAVEQAARDAGHDVTVPFAPGRTDASQEQTDVETFAVLEPTADGFRNYLRAGEKLPPEQRLLDRANLLTLTAPEMTVLVGGLRALGTNHGQLGARCVHRPARDVDQRLLREPARHGHGVEGVQAAENVYEGRDRATGDVRWTATAVDLVFGSNSQLRAIAEVYAADDAGEKFVRDFVAAWDKVMRLDRFDLG